MEDVGGRRDGVGPEDQRATGAVRGGDETVGERDVAGDVAVVALLHRSRSDLVAVGEVLGRLAVVEPGSQRREVGREQLGLGAELGGEEPLGQGDRPGVEPREQAQREHVGGAFLVLARQVERRERLDGDRRERDGVDVVALERSVLERVGRVSDLREVALGELVGVGDDRRAARDVGEVGLERGGVHRDEDVRLVARGEHVVVGEVQLEAGDARQGPLGRADLRGEVGQRRQVVAEDGRLGREPVTGQLHTVARVAGEADDDAVELDGVGPGGTRRGGRRGGHDWDHQNSWGTWLRPRRCGLFSIVCRASCRASEASTNITSK